MKKVGAALGRGHHMSGRLHPHSPAAHHTAILVNLAFFLFFFLNQAGGWLVVKLGLNSRLPKPRALLCTLLLLLFITFQRPRRSPLSSLQAQLGQHPGPKSPARGSLVSGVAARRPPLFTHWAYSLALAAPWETGALFSAGRWRQCCQSPQGLGGGVGGALPERQGRGSLLGLLVMSPQPVQSGPLRKAASPGGRSGSFLIAPFPVFDGPPPLQPRL